MLFNRNRLCKIGIHKWRISTTFSKAVPEFLRNELRSNMHVCTRCAKVKKVPYERWK